MLSHLAYDTSNVSVTRTQQQPEDTPPLFFCSHTVTTSQLC